MAWYESMFDELTNIDETMNFAYLKSTEKRIVNELMCKANYSTKEITEEMVIETIKNEKMNFINQNAPKAITESIVNLLNIIEKRLLHAYTGSSNK